MGKRLFIAAGVLGLLGVAGGAFGAHALRNSISEELLNVYETGIRYQMYHVVAIALSGWGFTKYKNPHFKHAGWLFIAGVALFSGSLYIMTFTGALWLGAVTPLGGVALLAGWLFLIIGFWKVP